MVTGICRRSRASPRKSTTERNPDVGLKAAVVESQRVCNPARLQVLFHRERRPHHCSGVDLGVLPLVDGYTTEVLGGYTSCVHVLTGIIAKSSGSRHMTIGQPELSSPPMAPPAPPIRTSDLEFNDLQQTTWSARRWPRPLLQPQRHSLKCFLRRRRHAKEPYVSQPESLYHLSRIDGV